MILFKLDIGQSDLSTRLHRLSHKIEIIEHFEKDQNIQLSNSVFFRLSTLFPVAVQ